MSFETITPEVKNVHPLIESYSLNMSFLGDAILGLGAVVKLKSDGQVGAVTVATDHPFATVVAPNKAIAGRVTVQTNFCIHKYFRADGAVTCGNLLSVTGHHTDGVPKMKVAVTTNYVYAQALETVADTAYGYCGVFRTARLI